MRRRFHRHRRHRVSETVYRSRHDRVLAGVCGGLAAHFGVNSLWIRLAFVVAFLSTGLPLFLYIVCIFIMPKEGFRPGYVPPLPEEAMRRRPRFRNQREALDELQSTFDAIENKVRGMEDHVTSREYVLKRKFENL